MRQHVRLLFDKSLDSFVLSVDHFVLFVSKNQRDYWFINGLHLLSCPNSIVG